MILFVFESDLHVSSLATCAAKKEPSHEEKKKILSGSLSTAALMDIKGYYRMPTTLPPIVIEYHLTPIRCLADNFLRTSCRKQKKSTQHAQTVGEILISY